MKTVLLNGIEIPYNITKKNNKNTYFYFKRDGYIQINLSRYQRVKDALSHMEQHAEIFAKKYIEQTNKQEKKSGYSLWGIPYTVKQEPSSEVEIDLINHRITYDEHNIDHQKSIQAFEKKIMLAYIDELTAKYSNNNVVDITDVTYKTRYTTSRHGSCHPKRRNIHINTHLIRFDKRYTEYVFCHEIAHLKVANHSKEFYTVLQQLYPDYKDTRKALKRMW